MHATQNPLPNKVSTLLQTPDHFTNLLGYVYFGPKNLNFISEMTLNRYKWVLISEMEISSLKRMVRLLRSLQMDPLQLRNGVWRF
jgi:hypothetical protein